MAQSRKLANGLTVKQDRFCTEYIKCGVLSEAYRLAYKADKMQADTIHKRAHELMNNGKVAGRIERIREELNKRTEITIDSLTDELNDALKVAIDNGSAQAMVTAIMSKAKLHGLITDKSNVKVDKTISPEPVSSIDSWLEEIINGHNDKKSAPN